MPIIKTQSQTIYLQEGETILEALERTGHAVEFQCRRGYCGSCRANLVQGKVTYLQNTLAYIRPGEFLPCCTVPQTDIIVEHVLKKNKL